MASSLEPEPSSSSASLPPPAAAGAPKDETNRLPPIRTLPSIDSLDYPSKHQSQYQLPPLASSPRSRPAQPCPLPPPQPYQTQPASQPPAAPSHRPTIDGPLAHRRPPPALQHAESPPAMDLDAVSVASTHTFTPDGAPDNAFSIADPDVRLAAEALGNLRADFVSSPPDSASLPPMSPRMVSARHTPPAQTPQPEPLLSLLTTSHPLISSTIGGASVAYGGAKNFSPRFKSGAEYVEGYLTPIANTVNSVGRVTGVEGGVRWFLGARRHDSEPAGSSKKRRKMANDPVDQAAHARKLSELGGDASPPAPKSRRLSSSTIDTLPAYDDQRSPAYTETAGPENPPPPTPSSAPWQNRLIMFTSGLSVAMSAESLRSLKYCLRWLRWSNDHMSRVIGNLKAALEEYEQTGAEGARAESAQEAADGVESEAQASGQKTPEESRAELAHKINFLKLDVLKTLQEAINTVSKYTGGALPENARVLVHRHLTTLPQRFRIATMSNAADGADRDSESAIRDGAQKILVLAKEGLDMVTQITGVVDGTIVSAEQWCERFGKKRRPSTGEDEMLTPGAPSNGDVKMIEAD